MGLLFTSIYLWLVVAMQQKHDSYCKSIRDQHDSYSGSMVESAFQALKDGLALTRISLSDFPFQ